METAVKVGVISPIKRVLKEQAGGGFGIVLPIGFHFYTGTSTWFASLICGHLLFFR